MFFSPSSWFLLLSLLFQSLGPAVYAASNTDRGIWTVSCAGRPIWLALPGQDPAQQPEHADQGFRHCLLCNHASADAMPAAGGIPAAGFFSNCTISANIGSGLTTNQFHKPYQPRAPPVLLQH